MKRFTFFILAAAALMFGACDSQNFAPDLQDKNIEESVITTITANHETTDTKSYLSVVGDYANVLWKSGDSFNLYATNDGSTYIEYPFSTTDNGVTKATFSTAYSVASTNYYFAVSPKEAGGGAGIFTLNGNPKLAGFGTIPNTQVATAGSFDPSAGLAVAYSEGTYDLLSFHNMVSLLKIRVSGSRVSNLKTIRIQCQNQAVSGLLGVYYEDAQLKYAIASSDPSYNFVELKDTGTPFTADTDYYIAVAPGDYQGISVTFLFDDDTYFSKTLLGDSSLTLPRSSVRNLGSFDLDAGTSSCTLHKNNLLGTRPVVICVIPDGFQTSQQTAFTTYAEQATDYLFSVEPYKTYKDYFKVYFLWTPSVDTAASITTGASTVHRNTAFGSRWGESTYDDMTADDGKVYSFVAANCPEIVKGTHTIDEVAILMLINDSRYGGIAHSTATGRTYCQTPIIHGGAALHWSFPKKVANSDEPMNPLAVRSATPSELALTTDGDWKNVMLHEFGGHSFGRLGDEYWDTEQSLFPGQEDIESHSWTVPFAKNVSGHHSTVPWDELLTPEAISAMNTKDSEYHRYTARIGKFQGAGTIMFNRWRSEQISCMIDNRPYFSTWQRKLIVERILKLANGTTSLDLSAFLSNDVITNPAPPATKAAQGPVKFMPPLPPPILIDNSRHESSILVGTPVQK